MKSIMTAEEMVELEASKKDWDKVMEDFRDLTTGLTPAQQFELEGHRTSFLYGNSIHQIDDHLLPDYPHGATIEWIGGDVRHKKTCVVTNGVVTWDYSSVVERDEVVFVDSLTRLTAPARPPKQKWKHGPGYQGKFNHKLFGRKK